MIREVQTVPTQTTRAVKVVEPASLASTFTAPSVCPKHGKPMVERNNR